MKVFFHALRSQHSKLSWAPSSGSYNLNYITVPKENKEVHRNPHIVVLYLLTLLKEQHGAFPHTTEYIHISQDSHLNLRLQFALQISSGTIILAEGGEEKKKKKEQFPEERKQTNVPTHPSPKRAI